MDRTSSKLPIRIIPGNLETSVAIESWVHRKLAGAFHRYGSKMTAIEVHFEDVNGPKHGNSDTRCLMEARVNGRTPIAVTARSNDLYGAIDAAARRLNAALGRAIGRSNTRARHRFRHGRGLDAHGPFHATESSTAQLKPSVPAGQLSGERSVGGAKKVIIAGYGPVGRALADQLSKLGVPFTVIDANPATARTQERLGISVLCGDTTNPDVLRAAGIETAAAIAITIPDGDDAVRACAAARSLASDIHIAARTTFLFQGFGALRAGANSITVEEIATAQAMAREVAAQVAGIGRIAQ